MNILIYLTQHLPSTPCEPSSVLSTVQGTDLVNLVQLAEKVNPSQYYQEPVAHLPSMMETQPQARAVRVEIPHSCLARAQHSVIRYLGCGKQAISCKIHPYGLPGTRTHRAMLGEPGSDGMALNLSSAITAVEPQTSHYTSLSLTLLT